MALLLLVAGGLLLAAFFAFGRWYVQADPRRLAALVRPTLIALATLAAALLALTGRLWLVAVLAPLVLPALRLLRRQAGNPRVDAAPPPAGAAAMSVADAYRILGLAPGAGEGEIEAAHHRLIALVHPDKGGSSFLAAQVNRARDLLLGR